MSKKDLFLLCPEVSPANRQKMAREPAHFVQVRRPHPLGARVRETAAP